MDSKYLVTVLCSTYNSAKWIEGYLCSLNDQLLENFKVIFVDANSDDGSLETIKNFSFREGIFVDIVECDSKIPIYEAWNIAIERAETSYVLNINTDDRLFPGGLTSYLTYAEANPEVDVFYCSYLVTGDAEHTQVTGLRCSPPHDHKTLWNFCYCGPFPMLKRNSVIEDGLFNPKYVISGDYEMWLRMSKKGRNFFRVQEPLGTYFENPEGVSTDKKHFDEIRRQDSEIRRIYV